MSAKTVGIGTAIIVALAGGVGGTWWMLQPDDPPPPPPQVSEQSPEEVAQYMASEQFAKLDEAKKQEYFEKAADKLPRTGHDTHAVYSQLNEQQRRQLRRNVRPLARRMMRRRMEKYFETNDPREKLAFLDEMIDEMQARRQARGDRSERAGTAGPADTSTQPDNRDRPDRRRRFTPQRLKRVLETVPPEDRAKFVQFMSDIRKRMKQRGIKPRWRRH